MPTIAFETFKYVSDSLRDTVSDSIDVFAQNSHYQWDTLHITSAVPLAPTGLEGIPLSNSVETSPFVFIGIIVLLFLPLFVFFQSPNFLNDSFSMILKEKNRQSMFRSFRSIDPTILVLLSIFFVFLLSLYIFNFSFSHKIAFSYSKLGLILMVTAAFFTIKILFIRFLTYVFFDSAAVRVTTIDYLNILSISGLLIFPLLIFRIYTNPHWHFYLDIATTIALITNILLVILKLFRLFFSKFIDLFYILLYLCTLEILPVFGLLKVYQLIV
ncbi:MAG: DUF4271 domain-containing protein [Prevotellaceae bacterium]|jgi:hypothetical protein|nr:DUF4271 domain-containing protein [Prevotellaceae bacterium]